MPADRPRTPEVHDWGKIFSMPRELELAQAEIRKLTRENAVCRQAALEEAARCCENYAGRQWDRYKRGDASDPKSGRADLHVQGLSCGGDECATLIRAIAQQAQPGEREEE